MIWIYRICFIPALLLALPYYGYRMLKRGGYGKDFSHRFGSFPQLPPKTRGRLRIWIQAVSVGEVLAAGALIREFKSQLNAEVVLTTTTSTGYAEACKRYAEGCLATGIFPLDFICFTRRAWRKIEPDLIVTMESELWPEHLNEANRRKVPVFVVNARVSDRSFGRYQKFGGFVKHLLSQINAMYPASDGDFNRLVKLGMPKDRMLSLGNLKFDGASTGKLNETERRALREELGFPPLSFGEGRGNSALVLLGSSTWAGEEALLISIQKAALEKGIDCRLLLVPRHAERRGEIRKLLAEQDLPWHMRSIQAQAPTGTMIYLADTTGELSRLSEIADLAFIGKSMPPNHGGQTPIEAASLGIPVVIGPQMENFRDIAKNLVQSAAARQVRDAEELTGTILGLLCDGQDRAGLAEGAKAWRKANGGVARRVVEDVARILNQSSPDLN